MTFIEGHFNDAACRYGDVIALQRLVVYYHHSEHTAVSLQNTVASYFSFLYIHS